jgi:hypothetical protein
VFRRATAETQQKRGNVLALDSVVLDHGIASPHEVPHRLVTFVRHPDRRQLASPEQLHEINASRRLVLTRSPGLDGISDGATTMQSWPMLLISR